MTPAYAPADATFSLVNLATTLTAAEMATAAVEASRLPYQDKVADRAALVKGLGPRITQALAYVKCNSAWAPRYEAVKRLADKVRRVDPLAYAKKKARKAKAEGGPAAPEREKGREQGELSHVEIAARLKDFIDRLDGLDGYSPADPRITIAGLTALHAGLAGLNATIPGLARTRTDDVADRRAAFEKLRELFRGVKTSVKGQYGQDSLPYAAIRGMGW